MIVNYFTQWDFDNCTPKCRQSDMHPETMLKLNKARDISGIPFILNSAFRSVEHEKKMGRAGTSAHANGRAIDIKATTGRTKFIVVDALIKAGFTRIGVHPNFIHADDDPTKDQKLIWLY
jgi:uncharacterized protein YcbK (DUF882 family)